MEKKTKLLVNLGASGGSGGGGSGGGGSHAYKVFMYDTAHTPNLNTNNNKFIWFSENDNMTSQELLKEMYDLGFTDITNSLGAEIRAISISPDNVINIVDKMWAAKSGNSYVGAYGINTLTLTIDGGSIKAVYNAYPSGYYAQSVTVTKIY